MKSKGYSACRRGSLFIIDGMLLKIGRETVTIKIANIMKRDDKGGAYETETMDEMLRRADHCGDG